MDDETTVVETETAEIGEIMARARAARTLRGLPRPKDLPPGGWYSAQRRKLAGGKVGVYLMYRWRAEPGSSSGNARSLGRLS